MGRTYRRNPEGQDFRYDKDKPWKSLKGPGRDFKTPRRREARHQQNLETQQFGEVSTVVKKTVQYEYW